ncbi:hypothetical protein HHI36_011051 [Cryptolaemus montrouzieri]|uniref:Uncharacterized protein n=1 Tax=Cryptolaemus montrouzieri TaxID=559131 RepID=A0ABD2MKL7_9CUCU
MKDPTEKPGLNTLMTLSKSILSVDVRTTTSLDLTSCCLTYIPSVLKDLPLRNLKLSKNKLKEIPECLYLGLEKLEYLDLCHNQIKTFEVEPKCCETLKMLNISYNKMADIPQWILCLYATNLEELCYDFNRVTCLRCIFDNPEKFPVKKLSMKNCILRKEDCNFLKQCKNLEQLNISNSTESTLHSNIIENVEQLFIQPNWKNINILKLNNIAISIFPENLTWLETLTELHLTHNDFMWLPIDGLEFLVNLEVLDLSHNSLYSIPDKLCWLENLKVLKLNFNNIESIPDFSKMERLEILDLYYNKLLNFEYNMDTKNLKYLDLEFNYFNTEDYGLVSYEHKRDEFQESYKMKKGSMDIERCMIVFNLLIQTLYANIPISQTF